MNFMDLLVMDIKFTLSLLVNRHLDSDNIIVFSSVIYTSNSTAPIPPSPPDKRKKKIKKQQEN